MSSIFWQWSTHWQPHTSDSNKTGYIPKINLENYVFVFRDVPVALFRLYWRVFVLEGFEAVNQFLYRCFLMLFYKLL